MITCEQIKHPFDNLHRQIKEANARADKAEQQLKQIQDAVAYDVPRWMRLRTALESMVGMCENAGDFRNGNVCQGVDEGEVMAGRVIDEAKAVLKEV